MAPSQCMSFFTQYLAPCPEKPYYTDKEQAE